jgi:outer membrane protein TolC
VARDLAEIEARLKNAQAELEAVTNERREALERLGRLHADRLGEHDGEGEGGTAAGEPPPPESP